MVFYLDLMEEERTIKEVDWSWVDFFGFIDVSDFYWRLVNEWKILSIMFACFVNIIGCLVVYINGCLVVYINECLWVMKFNLKLKIW